MHGGAGQDFARNPKNGDSRLGQIGFILNFSVMLLNGKLDLISDDLACRYFERW